MPILSECSDCNVTYIVSEFGWYWTKILVQHLFVRWTKSIRSTLSHPMCFKSILILSSHLLLGFRHIPFFRFLNQKPLLSHSCNMPRLSRPPRFIHLNNVWWSEQIMKLLVMKFSPVSCHLLPLSTLFSNTQKKCTGYQMFFDVPYTVC
jgi:hypothetical protein